MVVLVIADDDLALPKIPVVPVDVIISCGDLAEEMILRTAERLGNPPILGIKGNHDSGGAFPAPIQNLHLTTVTVGELTFGGFEGCLDYKPVGNYLYSQAAVSEQLEGFPRVDVFVAHNSPANIHDRADGIHNGFSAFHRYIETKKPRLMLHGHQHVNEESTLYFTKVIGTYGHRMLSI